MSHWIHGGAGAGGLDSDCEEVTMMAPLPHRYEVHLDWPGHGGAELTAGPRPPIEGGVPPEFDGRDSWWSPEHLLLSSLSLCLLRVELEVDPADAERARTLVAKAKKHCLVASALRPVVDVEVSVLTRSAAGVR